VTFPQIVDDGKHIRSFTVPSVVLSVRAADTTKVWAQCKVTMGLKYSSEDMGDFVFRRTTELWMGMSYDRYPHDWSLRQVSQYCYTSYGPGDTYSFSGRRRGHTVSGSR